MDQIGQQVPGEQHRETREGPAATQLSDGGTHEWLFTDDPFRLRFRRAADGAGLSPNGPGKALPVLFGGPTTAG
ncbi:hypothetical protein AB0L80_27410 [Streptomyces sp. NPDC052069]|uniref:hypothetical protein n=1 Tax=Streptomyces sp. NPDC052069 TaxID=3154650 RepID=UPI00341A9AE8